MTTHSDADTRRVLGVPVSGSGLMHADARLRAFEPENPRLFVPRTFGIGWDLNFGAVAVRLGLMRPDDSVPDLVEHIPAPTIVALRVAPLIGAAAATIAGIRTAQQYDRLPTNWGITFQPTRWGSAPAAMAVPVLLSAGAGIWAEITTRRASTDNSHPTVDVTAAAQALGLQAMSLTLIAAAVQAADNPRASRLLPLAGIVAAPAVTTGVFVTTVRSALRALNRKLRSNRTAIPR